MTSSGQGKPPPMETAVIQELIKGREAATRLGVLLKEATPGNPVMDAYEEVLGSLFSALSLLDSVQSPIGFGRPRSENWRSEASRGERKICPVEDNRGGRRRRTQTTPHRIVPSKTLNDGHTWRKYGQKDIQNSKFPRAYFRCTHKHDQGCKAIRQVQRSEEDDSMFIITYIGEHTCRDPAILPRLISSSNLNESWLISFGLNSTDDNGQEGPLLPSFPSHKQECDEGEPSNLSPGSTSSEHFMPSSAWKGSKLTTSIMGSASEHGDVSSAFHSSTSSLDLDFMTDSFELGDIFGFDQDGFLQD